MAGIKVTGPGKKKKKAKAKSAGIVAPSAPPKRFLDAAAYDYAKLLSDPCNAKVVPPIYPGSDAGFLFRADSFGSVGTGASQTAGYIHWTPGYPNATNTDFLLGGAADSATAVAAAAFAQGPGKPFINANSRAVRCIAACMRISFPGAESARSGRIHYGLTPGGLLDVSNSVTPDAVAQALSNYTRTPADMIELVWKPSIADTDFCDPTEAASASIRDRKQGLTVAFAGLPATVGLTYHLTAVYEWQPAAGLGVAQNPNGKANSRNTLDDVVDFLLSHGETFVRSVASTYMGGMATNLLGAVSATFGNMPSQSRTRARPMA